MNELKGKLNAISLFTGYAGIDLALREYVRPLIYCEIEQYPQAILLSRMDEGSIEFAPIWNDVTTLNGNNFKGLVDIVYGGFPCQDISVAGKGAGLEGKRSGLFYDVIRLCKEASPTFIFLENVPAIRTRGAIEVQEALANIGYASRWTHISAAEVGANHKRERWFCLATNTKSSNDRISNAREGSGQVQQLGISFSEADLANPVLEGLEGLRITERVQPELSSSDRIGDAVYREIPHADVQRRGREAASESKENDEGIRKDYWRSVSSTLERNWWQTEPDVGRVVNGVANRMDRIKALGNGVVPLQVKTAFEILMGIK